MTDEAEERLLVADNELVPVDEDVVDRDVGTESTLTPFDEVLGPEGAGREPRLRDGNCSGGAVDTCGPEFSGDTISVTSRCVKSSDPFPASIPVFKPICEDVSRP